MNSRICFDLLLRFRLYDSIFYGRGVLASLYVKSIGGCICFLSEVELAHSSSLLGVFLGFFFFFFFFLSCCMDNLFVRRTVYLSLIFDPQQELKYEA